MLRITDLNSSREENRWLTWSPEYISVIVKGLGLGQVLERRSEQVGQQPRTLE
jgi:hypothetical protein